MPYDLSATVHHTPRRSDSGHYMAISRSQDLQSHEWFIYDDDRVSPSKFTNIQKKHAVVLKFHTKTATILFYVSPSLETRIKNAKTIDLMEVEKEKEHGVKDSGDIDADGEEGDADGYSMTTRMMKKKKGKVEKRTCQVETSPRGHQTRRVEQGPWGHQTRRVEQGPRTPLESAAHVVSTQD